MTEKMLLESSCCVRFHYNITEAVLRSPWQYKIQKTENILNAGHVSLLGSNYTHTERAAFLTPTCRACNTYKQFVTSSKYICINVFIYITKSIQTIQDQNFSKVFYYHYRYYYHHLRKLISIFKPKCYFIFFSDYVFIFLYSLFNSPALFQIAGAIFKVLSRSLTLWISKHTSLSPNSFTALPLQSFKLSPGQQSFAMHLEKFLK